MGTEVNGEPVVPAQAGIVSQCGTQAGLPAAAGIPAALFKVGHGAQVHRAGRKQLPREHAAGLHRIGGWRVKHRGEAGAWFARFPRPSPFLPPHSSGDHVQGCVCVCVHVYTRVYMHSCNAFHLVPGMNPSARRTHRSEQNRNNLCPCGAYLLVRGDRH